MDSILRPVLQPVLQPVLRSVFCAASGGASPSLRAQVQALFVDTPADGGMYDFNDASTLRQNSNGTTAVGNGDPIGYVEDLSGNGNHLTQPTATARPAWGDYASTTGLSGATGNRVVYDFVDDHLRYPGSQGEYTVAFMSVSGVQVYTVPALWVAGGNLRVPVAETPGLVIINRSLDAGEIAVVTAWLESLSNVRPAEPYYWEGRGMSYAARGGTATDPLWTFGDGSTQSSMSGWTETLSPRETIAFEYTALTQFNCSTNQLTGSIPSLSANTALTQFHCSGNQLTAVDGGFAVPITLGEFRANNCQLSQAAVDAILAAFVAAGRNSGTRILALQAGNAAPSGAGLADKATLESRGWTVTVTP